MVKDENWVGITMLGVVIQDEVYVGLRLYRVIIARIEDLHGVKMRLLMWKLIPFLYSGVRIVKNANG